jgi:hypothetical protein
LATGAAATAEMAASTARNLAVSIMVMEEEE